MPIYTLELTIIKKLSISKELSNLLDEIKANNPSAYLILSGDFNVALDDNTQVSAALSGLLDKFRMTDIYRKMFPDKKKSTPFSPGSLSNPKKAHPRELITSSPPQKCWIHTMETLEIIPRNLTTI